MTSFKVYLYWWLGLFPHCAKYECSYQGSVVCPVKNDLRFICRDGWCISFWAAPQIPKAAGPLTHLTTGYYSQVLSTPHHSCIISSLAWWNGCQVDSTWCLPKLRSWEILFWRRSRNTRIRWIPAHPEITLTASSRDSVRRSIFPQLSSTMTTWRQQCWTYTWQELKPPAQLSDLDWVCWSNTPKYRRICSRRSTEWLDRSVVLIWRTGSPYPSQMQSSMKFSV